MDISGLGAWTPLLQDELQKPYFQTLAARVDEADAHGAIYPPAHERFAAFQLTPPQRVRVVILGQDPYHEPGQAHGLAFSVRPGVKLPPSLVNIYRELQTDLGIEPGRDGCLAGWAGQGVLLLNTVLSVRAGAANSHKDFGWQTFTDAVVDAIGTLDQPVVFILWGAQAQKKAASITRSPYPRLAICSPHPSPLSAYRGFFGSRPFSRANAFLRAHGQAEIDWAPGLQQKELFPPKI